MLSRSLRAARSSRQDGRFPDPSEARCGRPLCYTASMRAGRTRTTSFSLDEATLASLKRLAARRHKGNVSALLAEFAAREVKFAAAEAFFTKYGVPPLTEQAIEAIEAEWRGQGRPRKKKPTAA
jgi:hypothetical protein